MQETQVELAAVKPEPAAAYGEWGWLARRACLAFALLSLGPAFGAGDAKRGAQAFQACAACHSLEPGRHMTGPSGPARGQPALVGQGMQGDRAQVVFSTPGEISGFIGEGC